MLTIVLLLISVTAAEAQQADEEPAVAQGETPDGSGDPSNDADTGTTGIDEGTERRLIQRSSSERIDGVVIALFSIAGALTVMLGFFLWHTSPRRRLRLAREREMHRLAERSEDSDHASV